MSQNGGEKRHVLRAVILVLCLCIAGIQSARPSSPAAGNGAQDQAAGGYVMSDSNGGGTGDTISLPEVPRKGAVSVEEAIWRRRSIRSFSDEVPKDDAVSRLLWAAQGITEGVYGLRSAPSAGATYPLELLLATSAYLARYVPQRHCLVVMQKRDVREELSGAALGQSYIAEAPLVFIFAAEVSRTAGRYGERADRYVHIEVGCASENLMLEAAALGLGSVAIGAYYDDKVSKVLGLPGEWEPYLIVPVGVPAE